MISANKTQGGCVDTDPATCPQTRGGLVNINASTTWQDQGIYGLGLEQNIEDYLGEYDSGDFGFDTLGVGSAGDARDDVDGQVIAALATKDYDVGFLGVTDYPTNFTVFDDPHPSYLSTLKIQNRVPSLSYAYSAGAQYRMTDLDTISDFVIDVGQVPARPMVPLHWAGMIPQSLYRIMFLSQWQAIIRGI